MKLLLKVLTAIFILSLSCFFIACKSENGENKRLAEEVVSAINLLPEENELLLSDEIEIISARESYNLLPSGAKKLVSNYEKLTKLEEKLTALKTENEIIALAQNVIIEINALPSLESITLENENAVISARANYNDLNSLSKERVDNLDKLIALENKIIELKEEKAILESAQGVVDKIASLPSANEITLGHKNFIAEIRAEYNALCEEAKALVTNLVNLQSAEDRILELELMTEQIELAKPVVQEIESLPSVEELTLSDESAVISARESYEALDSEIKLVVNNSDKLIALEERIEKLKEEEIAKTQAQSVINAITNINSAETLTLSDKTAVESARADYNALSSLAQTFVSNYDKLLSCEEKIEELERVESLKQEAKVVIDEISLLPSESELKLSDSEKLISARNSYDSLREEVKTYVTNISVLISLEAKLEELKNQPSSDGFMTTITPMGISLLNKVYTITMGGEYIFSGTLENGQIYVNAPGEKVEITLNGVTMKSSVNSCIYVESAEKVTIKVCENTQNFLTDERSLKSVEDALQGSATIYSKCDLFIEGSGSLEVIGSYYNAIHTKNDLRISEVNLFLKAPNNALKGNDTITINSGSITAISTGGNGLKTDNSDISSKGNQRGTISILGGQVNVYAALDGIDASYNVEIDGNAVLNVYTDSYSQYTADVVQKAESTMYISMRSTYYSTSYRYAVKFYNSTDDYVFVNANYKTSATSGRYTYYYYSLTMPSGYQNFAVYRFSSSQSANSQDSYSAKTSGGTINTAKDTFAISSISGSNISGDWTTYSTTSTGTAYSMKGIKADNEIFIRSGSILVNATDDGLHASNGKILGNGETGVGNINIYGGSLTITSKDDGIHADYTLNIVGGEILVVTAYEGLEANLINISGGATTVTATDDGVNCAGTITSPVITISGGQLDVTVGTGDVDGIDSNGSYVQTGGFVITRNGSGDTSGNMAALDTDGSITITGGTLVAVGSMGKTPSGVNYVKWGSTGGMGGGFGGVRPGQSAGGSSGGTFSAGTYTISGTDITFTLNGSYSNMLIASSQFVLNSSYTLTNGSATKTWTQSSSGVSGS